MGRWRPRRGGNVSIYGIDPRGLTDLGDRKHRGRLAFRTTSASALGTQSLQNELRLSQKQPAAAFRRHRWIRGGQQKRFSRPPSIASCATTARTTRWRITRRATKRGKFHKIEVRVRRPDLRVRARQGYVTLKPAFCPQPRSRMPRRPAAATNNLTTLKLREVLDSPLPVSGLCA